MTDAGHRKDHHPLAPRRFAARVDRALRIVASALALLMIAACLSSAAADVKRQTGEVVFKGHRLTTSIDELTHQGIVELDDRQIIIKDAVAEIGQISTFDLGSSFLYVLHMKTKAGCGSSAFVHVAPLGDTTKNEVLSEFGACNDQVAMQVDLHSGWGAWYAVAYRDDRATAQVAFIRDDKFATQQVKAPPCLFVATARNTCMQSLLADAVGSGELGLTTGSGSFAGQKVEAFLNRATGKATLQLNGRVFHTFDNAKDFYLANVEDGNQFAVFVFFLRPATGCVTRPLMFFAERSGAPTLTLDYAPCTDQMARMTNKKGNTVEWSGLAFHLGEPRGYIASVVDHKLALRATMLPACMMEADKFKDPRCVLEALGKPVPAPAQPPQVRVIPAPSRTPPPKPRTLGI